MPTTPTTAHFTLILLAILIYAPMELMGQACDAALAERITLKADELGCLYDKFNEHFRRDTDVRLRDPEEEVAWTVIESKLMAVGGAEQGLIIRYGLLDGEIVLGLSFVPLVKENTDTYSFDDIAPVYILDGTELSFAPITYEEWIRDYVDETWPLNNGHYFSEVEVKHTATGDFDRVKRGRDSEYEVVPFTAELKLLYSHNSGLFTPNESAYLVFRCIARLDPDRDSNFYRHRVAMFMRMWHTNGSKRDLLDNSNITSPYELRNHGADLGHLCPPSCRRYVQAPLKLN